MPSNSGSPEPPDRFTADMARETMAELRDQHYSPERRNAHEVSIDPVNLKRLLQRQQTERQMYATAPPHGDLTAEEQDCIADGEPYCFRCGKPASSFSEYVDMSRSESLTQLDGDVADAAGYVRREEGTYNPDTNRFACDACYIAIGMPVGPLGVGWKAP